MASKVQPPAHQQTILKKKLDLNAPEDIFFINVKNDVITF